MRTRMGMGSISGLSSNYLQSILGTALQGTGLTNKTSGHNVSGTSSTSLQPDNSQLSPFAQLLSTLQQLQQSDPGKYQQVTQQIATNLQGAAQTAQANGNSTAANQLNQLATDFTNASKSGQMPNVQDLAQAIGGHHHHHHAHPASDPGSSSSDSSSNGASQTLSQLLSALQANSPQSESQNPMKIILDTLSSAGITGANG
jgi:hypothetical protein